LAQHTPGEEGGSIAERIEKLKRAAAAHGATPVSGLTGMTHDGTSKDKDIGPKHEGLLDGWTKTLWEGRTCLANFVSPYSVLKTEHGQRRIRFGNAVRAI